MARSAVRKTDFGTILLHWTLVILMLMAIATGLRIAMGSPYDLMWLKWLDPVLPQATVWTLHIPAGAMLFALSVTYIIYLFRARLFRRIQPDLARLAGIAGPPQARLSALNVILYWTFFLAILMVLGTGMLLYLGFAGCVSDLHLLGTAIVAAYIPAHILVHFAIGGRRQLLRIFNPAKLSPPPPDFDPFELMAQILEAKETARIETFAHGREARGVHAGVDKPRLPAAASRAGRRGQILHAHPLAIAIGGGIAALVLLMSLDQATRDELVIDELRQGAKPPIIDGDVSDPVWREAVPVSVRTQQGANLDGEGGAVVEIRAVHDGTYAYFSFVWNDPTRSLKHLPLAKTNAGWRLLQDNYDGEDANAYFEDKFAVLLASTYTLIPGDNTFHAGHSPLKNEPPSGAGRGLHYTADGSYVDVWEWRASEEGTGGWMDDSYFGPPMEPTEAQRNGETAYKGGFAPDPGEPSFTVNFDRRGRHGHGDPVLPRRLPQDFLGTMKALGTIDLDPNHGESPASRWWMLLSETVPYSPEADAKIPIGTIIPGIIMEGEHKGDRADVRCVAKWAAGRWALEVIRRLDTGSRYDVPIKTDSYLRVAVFDHTQSRHTRHIRPIHIKVNKCGKAVQCLSTIRSSLLNAATFSWMPVWPGA